MESDQSTRHNESVPFLSSWDFIWSFFMYSPRVRSHLFQDCQPPVDQIVNTFLNEPTIFGYEFPMKNQNWANPRIHPPDIGDLKTLWTSVDETLLGYAFGSKGLFPIVPHIYACTNDLHYRNGKAKIRRTALRYVSIEKIDCFLSIEFAWMLSGLLAVTTCYTGIRTSKGDGSPERNGPVMDSGELRFFLPGEASILKNLSACFDEYALRESNPHNEYRLNISLPPRLLNPNFHFKYNVHERDDFETPKLFSTSFFNKIRNDLIAQVITESSIVGRFEQYLGLILAHQCRRKDFSYFEIIGIQHQNVNIYPEKSIIWKKYCSMIQESRQTGYLQCIVVQGNSTKDIPISYLENMSAVQYKCLFTMYGLSIQGRVQKLLNQLNLHYSKPDLDYTLQACDVRFQSFGSSYLRKRVKLNVNLQDVTAVETSKCSTENYTIQKNDMQYRNNTEKIKEAYDESKIAGSNRGLAYQLKKYNRMNNNNFSIQDDADNTNSREKESDISAEYPYSDNEFINYRRKEPSDSIDQDTKSTLLSKRKRTLNNIETPRVRDLDDRDSAEIKTIVPCSDNNNCSSDNENTKVALNNSVEEKIVSIETSYGRMWKCNRCGIVARKRGNLKRHVLLKHYNLRQFQCQYVGCGRKFQTRINLNRHEVSVHDGRPFQCPKCTRKFKQKEDVEFHITNAHEKSGSSFICDTCGSCFDLKGTLNRHKRTVHHGSKP